MPTGGDDQKGRALPPLLPAITFLNSLDIVLPRMDPLQVAAHSLRLRKSQREAPDSHHRRTARHFRHNYIRLIQELGYSFHLRIHLH
jgi:hypothetical protein